jgi:hypothetical protein
MRNPQPAAASPTTGARLSALFLAAVLAGPATAQEEGPFGDPDERQQQLEPSPSLPQSFNGIIHPGEAPAPAPAVVATLRDVGRAIQACWQPTGVPYSGQEITILVSFKRNGEVLGKPRITHYRAGEQNAANREAFSQAVRDAFARCSPLPFSAGLGAAVAGRPFTFRFIDAPVPRSQSL